MLGRCVHTGCFYLNGPVQVILAQFLTFAGAWFSFAALGDCAFAEISVAADLIPGVELRAQRVGFITFEGLNGQCYWYNQFTDIISGEDQLTAYWNILGVEWQRVGVVGYVAAAFSWYFFWYTTSFCCSSQIRCCRFFNGFTMSVLITVLQGCTFLAFRTDFCDDFGCSFSRSAGWSVGAILCYFFAGLSFFAMSDYPGDRFQGRDQFMEELPKPEEVDEQAYMEAQTY